MAKRRRRPVRRRRVVRRPKRFFVYARQWGAPTETKDMSIIQLLKNRAYELPRVVRIALARRKLRLADHEYYSIVKANGAANVSMFSKSLDEGLATNMHQGVVPNDAYFMVSSIVITTATGDAASDIANAVTKDFTAGLDDIIQNAKVQFKCGQDVYLEDCAGGLFQGGKGDLEVGEYKLANPVFLHSKQTVELDIEGLGAALGAETWVKVRLKGILTRKK